MAKDGASGETKAKPAVLPIDEAAIERAEAALAAMSNSFQGWIEEEISLLSEAHEALRTKGLTAEAVDRFSQRAHDLKGQGTTLDFPFVTKIAELLCKLCEHLPEPSDLPLPLVDAHIDAIRAVVRDGIKGDNHMTGKTVIGELDTHVRHTLSAWRDKTQARN
ncbi:MAG TPA: Hpt domain-containing protein [Alphaproteobacteria bacterium]|nr:Hpt domain-containing protein [Alphaproteobacteria bacterium]